MAAFDFKLEPVLTQRDAELKAKQRQMASLTEQRLAFAQSLNKLHALVSADRHRMAEGLIGPVDVTRIRAHAAHAQQVVMRAGLIHRQQQQVHEQLEQAREGLLAAARAHKALTKLKDKRRTEWVRQMDRKETAAQDDLTTVRYARRIAAERGRS
ncbi:MAG: flagellar FliJ family protein [Phycisphaeraceae bacterium]|nr:flagellar FliJ family protein [Phycisphaeraceae bacterium]